MNHPQPDSDPERLRRAALRGARSAARFEQVIADAADVAMDRWVDARLRGRAIEQPEAWMFRVAANAAREIGGRGASSSLHDVPAELLACAAQERTTALVDVSLSDLRKLILARADRLIGRQLEVLLRMSEPGATVHGAAADLGMDRRSLRRSMRSGLRRISGQKSAPPLFLVSRCEELLDATHCGRE
jgi:hypothetical protein